MDYYRVRAAHKTWTDKGPDLLRPMANARAAMRDILRDHHGFSTRSEKAVGTLTEWVKASRAQVLTRFRTRVQAGTPSFQVGTGKDPEVLVVVKHERVRKIELAHCSPATNRLHSLIRHQFPDSIPSGGFLLQIAGEIPRRGHPLRPAALISTGRRRRHAISGAWPDASPMGPRRRGAGVSEPIEIHEPRAMLNVLVTMPFTDAQLDRLRAVSPDLTVTRAQAESADYSRTDILYAQNPPRDLSRAPRLRWVQLHMAGVNALHDHPLYTESDVPLTTTSGVHAPAIAEYAIAVLLALAHRVPRMVEWQARGVWPPDAQRWPLFVPTAENRRFRAAQKLPGDYA